MIRPKWLAHATALQRRCLTYSRPVFSVKGAESTIQDDKTQNTTIATRKQKSKPKDSKLLGRTRKDLGPQRNLSERRSSKSRVSKLPQKPQPKQKTVVTISGLSPSLKVSDFNRIAVQDLKDWSSAIEEVFQERDAFTLEPLGKWHVSFDSTTAAASFENKVKRLHELSQYKMSSQDGLWKNRVPSHLLSDRDVEEEVKCFTLAPGSQASLEISRGSKNTDWPCQRYIKSIITRSSFPGSKSIILATLQRPCFNQDDIEAFITEDGEARRSAWKISKPWPLESALEDELLDLNRGSDRVSMLRNLDYEMKLASRFALVCRDKDETWRFIRQWNQRVLEGHSTRTGGTERTMVNVSLIEQQ